MTNYTIYQIGTGKVIRSGYFTEGSLASMLLEEDAAIVPFSCNPLTEYILNEVKTARPELSAEPSNLTLALNDVFHLTNLPLPCTVTVEDAGIFAVTDGEIEFPLPLVGVYKITVSGFPYLDKMWEVTVV